MEIKERERERRMDKWKESERRESERGEKEDTEEEGRGLKYQRCEGWVAAKLLVLQLQLQLQKGEAR